MAREAQNTFFGTTHKEFKRLAEFEKLMVDFLGRSAYNGCEKSLQAVAKKIPQVGKILGGALWQRKNSFMESTTGRRCRF
jgi:hypothetical protein